ncbi:imelysin family protein [Taibaiella sp. KBW10]|uniref:imelysin family protein n=1 Tax=Taibaiella sp. KBW10 TaxID=2153357 RepID=UPI0013155594|nr:imelysin family protein [Taibaiella sp. KBW10]
MLRKILLYASLSTVFLLSLYACNKGKKKTDDTAALDRKPMLSHYADQYVLPGYDALIRDLNTLNTQAAAFTSTPNNSSLIALKNAWETAYLTWQTVDMLEFGATEEISLRSYMNTYPATESKIEANITAGNYNLETFGNKDAQGFPAVDYLINALDASGTIARFTTAANAAAYKTYLSDVIRKMQEKAITVKNNWVSGRNTFVDATGTDAAGGLSKMTNAVVLYYERYLRSGKVGYPVGAMTGVALPGHVEAYYSPELSKRLAIKALESFIAFYEGKNYDGTASTNGMKQYLSSIGTKDSDGTLMATVLSTSLTNGLTALQNLNGTLKDGVNTNRVAVLSVYDKLQLSVALLKVDMVSAFGISITYLDNDGD